MNQTSTTKKNTKRFTFLDKLLTTQEDAELKKDISLLIQDYKAFSILAASLSNHAKWIPYQFIVERTKKVADELRDFCEIIRVKVTGLGGQIPQDAQKLSSMHDGVDNVPGLQAQKGNEPLRQNIKKLVADMEEHSNRCEALYHQRNMIADAGTIKLLNQIIVDMQRQKDEMLDIVMRVS